MDSKINILLIDDKPSNVYSLEKLLEKPGREFLSAYSGAEGLRKALENEVDLIILDVQMPDMDGFEVAQILKSNKRTKEIPIIFASAEKKEHQSIMKGFEEGAVDYLSKPLDPELTKAKVSVLLKIQLQKRELIEKNLSLERADAQITQLNINLQKNLEQLEIMNNELESFSYSISHDLQSPLRVLLGYSKILEEDYNNQLNDDAKKILSIVQQKASYLGTMIENLLKFSKLGRQELQKSQIDILQLVQKIVNDTNDATGRVKIIVKELHSAIADPSLLVHVWANLISNALKYSSKKETPTIEIGSYKPNNEIVYYVKDNGSGFDMKYSDKLFGVFQRLHHESEFEGTGVGLSIVQRIILKHGGRVWAEGKINIGATFYFSLPE